MHYFIYTNFCIHVCVFISASNLRRHEIINLQFSWSIKLIHSRIFEPMWNFGHTYKIKLDFSPSFLLLWLYFLFTLKQEPICILLCDWLEIYSKFQSISYSGLQNLDFHTLIAQTLNTCLTMWQCVSPAIHCGHLSHWWVINKFVCSCNLPRF